MDNKIRAAITGVGAYVPEYVLTNKELEKMVDTNDEWITTRTGIKERRILKDADKGKETEAEVSRMIYSHVNPNINKTNNK